MSTGKEVTIYDLARMLHISPTTVSRGLQDHPRISKKTKQKIMALADSTGYRTNPFARSLRRQRTHTLGVIVPRLNSNFMSSVIAGLEQVVNEHGYSLLISQSSEESSREALNARAMFDSRVDGLLVSVAYDTTTLTHFEPFFQKGTPVLFFDRVMEHAGSTSILIDNYQAAYQATRHLLEQGCRHLVHITAPLQQRLYQERLHGFEEALREAGFNPAPEQVIVTRLSQEEGSRAAETLLGLSPIPDGVFVANDSCAVSCMLELKRRGLRIPQDIAFVGFNNDPVCLVVEPHLSSVDYNGRQMGQEAARHLIGHLDGTLPMSTTNTILLRSELVVRQSSLKNTFNT